MPTETTAAPTVSVIICGYNQGTYVKAAVESALAQTYPHVEVIVVDNGSTDESPAILRAYAGDARVRLMLHPTNAPVTRRLNEAIGVSTGTYISLLYADDYYLPNKLERQVAVFETLGPEYGVVYSPGFREDVVTGERWLDATLRRNGFVLKDMFLRSHTEGFINPISPLMRREVFLRYPFHEDVFAEGETIFFRFAMTYQFYFVDEPLTVMREHDSNMAKAIKVNIAIALRLFDKMLAAPEFPAELLPDANTYYGNLMGISGWLGIRMAADPTWARECFIKAIRRQPSQLRRPRVLAGLALSLLPAAVLRLFNRSMNTVRTHKETIAFKADIT